MYHKCARYALDLARACMTGNIMSTPQTREQWLDERRSGIGASDTAAIMGHSTFGSPMSVYAEKLGAKMDADSASSIRMRVGQTLEPLVLQLVSEKSSMQVTPNSKSYSMDMLPFMRATPDGFGDDRRPIETKVVFPHADAPWLAGTLPVSYMLQLQHQMLVTGQKVGTIGALLLESSELIMMHVDYDPEIGASIVDACSKFWSEHVIPRVPPPADGHKATGKAIRAMHPSDNGAMVPLDPGMLSVRDTMVDLKAKAKAIKADVVRCDNILRAAIGSASWGALPDGSGLSLLSQSRGDTVFRTLRTVKPGALAQIRKDGGRRTRKTS